MRFAVLGTGEVGQAIATKLVAVGHEVMMGSRSAGNERMAKWVEANGDRATGGTFAEAAASAEAVVNCTAGVNTLDALAQAGAENLSGKLLIDVANAVVVSGRIEPPTLEGCNTDSLAERIQRTYPDAKVVKTLNTINYDVMVNPARVPGEHVIFLSGDDPRAKSDVREVLGSFGWPQERVIDLGDVTSARGPEMFLALFSRLFLLYRTAHLSIAIQRAPDAPTAEVLR